MSSKKDSQNLKNPDAFLSLTDRFFGWAEEHATSIAGICGAVFVLAVAYVGYGYYVARSEAKASEALYAPSAQLKKVETEFRESRAKAMEERGKDKAKVAAPAALDYNKDFAPGVDQLKQVIKNYAGSRAALVSSISLASFLVQQKQFEQALEVIELPRYRPASGDVLSGFYNMHKGLVFLENKKFDQAIAAYEDVVKAKSLAYLHPEAMLKLGVAYEMKGDGAKARETYEKVSRDFPASDASKTAQQYIRLLERSQGKA